MLIPKAIKIALPMAIIIGLGIALWLAKRDANAWHHAYTAAVAAGVASEQRQIAANLAQEARWRAQAEKADANYQTALERADGRSSAFIAANSVSRLCAQGNRPAGGTDPMPETGDPGIPADPAPGSLVAVEPADIRTCAIDYTYAMNAHLWAKGL